MNTSVLKTLKTLPNPYFYRIIQTSDGIPRERGAPAPAFETLWRNPTFSRFFQPADHYPRHNTICGRHAIFGMVQCPRSIKLNAELGLRAPRKCCDIRSVL